MIIDRDENNLNSIIIFLIEYNRIFENFTNFRSN